MTRSLLLVVQQGYQDRPRQAPFAGRSRVYDLNILEPKLYAYDKASGRARRRARLARERERGADDVHGRRQAVRGVPRGRLDVPEQLIAVALP